LGDLTVRDKIFLSLLVLFSVQICHVKNKSCRIY
jgi:hypothetical protein